MTAQAPSHEYRGSILKGIDRGVVDAIQRAVIAEAREALTGEPLAMTLVQLRRITGSPAFREELADDILARFDVPLDQADLAAFEAAFAGASEAAVYELGLLIVAAAGGE